VALACGPASQGAQPTKQTTTEADVGAVSEIWKKYAEAESAGDAELWISLWTDDGVRMTPNRPAVTGTEQIRSQIQSLFDRYTADVAIFNEEVRVAGDW
jgi:uncharacterized protein (TIGR02246 family)